MNEAEEPAIYITYNPKAALEETLAVRLQTIGAVNGFEAFLPDRYTSNRYVNDETRYRIKASDYFVLFLTGPLSTLVAEEIKVAYQHFRDKKNIIIIYEESLTDEQLDSIRHYSEATLIPFEPDVDTPDVIVKQIIEQISGTDAQQAYQSKRRGSKDFNFDIGIAALLMVGLGLLIMALFTKDDS